MRTLNRIRSWVNRNLLATSVPGGRMTTIALQRHHTPRDPDSPSLLRSPNSRVGKSRYEPIPPRVPSAPDKPRGALE